MTPGRLELKNHKKMANIESRGAGFEQTAAASAAAAAAPAPACKSQKLEPRRLLLLLLLLLLSTGFASDRCCSRRC